MDSESSRLEMRRQNLVVVTVDSLQKENETLRLRIADLEAAAAVGAVKASAPRTPPLVRPSESTSAADGISTTPVNENKGSSGVSPTNDDRRASGDEYSEESRRSALGKEEGKGKGKGQKGKAGMTAAAVARYSRHLLVPAVGVEGQRNLLGKTCLVIGAGGLASAVLPYLAGAGVGHIKVIDFDKIETSNLHRQVLFREIQAGKSKAKSAAEAIRAINSSVRCTPIEMALTHDNAMDILTGVDLVVDASDNPRTRYLVNDACVLSGKPLVSGSALGMEGQVSVFHHQGGPCYRCVFPAPLAAEAGRRCSDNGVLGTVPGVIGCLQATEALKVLGDFGSPLVGRLCTYDAQDGSFYTVRLRPRSKACAVCGDSPTVTSMKESKQFASEHGLTVERGTPATEDVPTATCQEYESIVAEGKKHVLLDVRVEVQFAVCALDNAVNVPLSRLEASLDEVKTLSEDRSLPVYCVCRRGIDSRAAVAILARNGFHQAMDVAGGLTEWARSIDPEFPMY